MNKKEINKIIKRLLYLSDKIIDIFEILPVLSYHDKENGTQYQEQYALLKEYINYEDLIINNLSIQDLEAIFNELPNHDNHTDAYERLHIYLDDKIAEYYILHENESKEENFEEAEEEENEETVEQNIPDMEEEQEEINKYYIEEEDNEKYAGMVTDTIAIIALKKLYSRINNTLADNKKDTKYKKRLIKELKSYKYYVLSIDRNLEKIGINYHFDINSLPVNNLDNIDKLNIYHNNCVDTITRMYQIHDIDYEPTVLEEMLFNFLCFEEYLKELDGTSIELLLELCNELGKKNKSFYGEKLKEKLLRRK